MDVFAEYLTRWELVADGEPIITHSSRLLPVRAGGTAAMLKIATGDEEKFGNGLMVWWDGDGAAQVLEHDAEALLMERAEGAGSLADMARLERDDEACRILCGAVAQLHAPRDRPPPALIPLDEWFRDLKPGASQHGGILAVCWDAAQALLAAPQDRTVLHGDIHHGNVLDFGEGDWRAIDPKRLGGEGGFDYANIFCNPDLETSTAPGRLARRATVIAEAAGLERRRLLQWVLAWSGLSACWSLDDGDSAEIALTIAQTAAAELRAS